MPVTCYFQTGDIWGQPTENVQLEIYWSDSDNVQWCISISMSIIILTWWLLYIYIYILHHKCDIIIYIHNSTKHHRVHILTNEADLGGSISGKTSFVRLLEVTISSKNWVALPVGNEGMKPYMVMMGMKLPSFPTKGQPENRILISWKKNIYILLPQNVRTMWANLSTKSYGPCWKTRPIWDATDIASFRCWCFGILEGTGHVLNHDMLDPPLHLT